MSKRYQNRVEGSDMKCHFKCLLCLSLAIIFLFTPRALLAAGPLHTNGNIIVDSAGKRFIINGVNVEAYRDYDGCPGITDNLWINNNLSKMVTAMKNVNTHGGLNAVRLNYDSRYINQGSYQNLSKYLDIAQAFANAGIFVMASNHSLDSIPYTSGSSDYALAAATWKAVIDGFRARGIDQYLFIDPVNETPTYNTRADMINANEYILNYLRKTANYTGLVLLTVYWNDSQVDTTSYQTLITYDAGLLGGTANIAFDNHWYPPYWPVSTHVANSFVTAKTYPLIIGEMGWDYGYSGQDTPNPQYVTDLLNLLLSTGIPNGHNGVFPWIWKWCDNNTMTTPSTDYATLSDDGNLYKPFWEAVNSGGTTPTATPFYFPGDINKDKTVNIQDFTLLSNAFGTNNAAADINADGIVNVQDFTLLSNNFGKSS